MKQLPNNTAHTIRVYDDPDEDLEDDLQPEYDFSSLKAKPNPCAARALQRQAEMVDSREGTQSSEG